MVLSRAQGQDTFLQSRLNPELLTCLKTPFHLLARFLAWVQARPIFQAKPWESGTFFS